MHRRAPLALLSAPAAVLIAIGCSQASPAGFGALSDPTGVGGSAGSAGSATTSAGGSSVATDAGTDASDDASGNIICANEATDAGVPYDPDAGFTASPCQPSGMYNVVTTDMGDCDMTQFPALRTMTEMFDPSGPYPSFTDCNPPIPIFTASVCSVYIPQGTVCSLGVGQGQFTVNTCGYYECNAQATKCTWYLDLTLPTPTGGTCQNVQSVTATSL
jgi:hypothetical protein